MLKQVSMQPHGYGPRLWNTVWQIGMLDARYMDKQTRTWETLNAFYCSCGFWLDLWAFFCFTGEVSDYGCLHIDLPNYACNRNHKQP